MDTRLSSSLSCVHARRIGMGDWCVVLPRPESCVESDCVDGDDAEVTDTKDTGDSERDAELAVSVATGDGFRCPPLPPGAAPPWSADTCDEQMLATVVTRSEVAEAVVVAKVRPLSSADGGLPLYAAAARCTASAITEDA